MADNHTENLPWARGVATRSNKPVIDDVTRNLPKKEPLRELKNINIGHHQLNNAKKTEFFKAEQKAQKLKVYDETEDAYCSDFSTDLQQENQQPPVESLVKEESMEQGSIEGNNSVEDLSYETLNRVMEETRNPLLGFEEYESDIIVYLLTNETRYHPSSDYMRKQQDITSNMRYILVDWLVEVCDEYKLSRDTLHLAVNYIDRFLSRMMVARARLQLVGTAAMFLASKYEEIYPPEANEFVYVTDDTYSKSQVLRMEHLILKVLNFNLVVPTALTFLDFFLKKSNADSKVKQLSNYILDLTLLDLKFRVHAPSVVAASAYALAHYTIHQDWNVDLEGETGYELQKLKSCITEMYTFHRQAGSLTQQSIQERFANVNNDKVSDIRSAEELIFPGRHFESDVSMEQ